MSNGGHGSGTSNDWRSFALRARALLARASLNPADQQERAWLDTAMDQLLATEQPGAGAASAVAQPAPVPPAMVASPAMVPGAAAPAMAPTSPWAAPPAAPAVVPMAEVAPTPTAPAMVGAPSAAAAPIVTQGAHPIGVITFGENEKGALGQGVQRPPGWEPARAVALPDGARARQVAAGAGVTAYVLEDGTLYLSGTNSAYQHCDTNSRGRDVPTAIPGLAGRNVQRLFLSGSSTHLFAILDGRLHGWGRQSLALGLDRRAITVEPTPVERLGSYPYPGGVPADFVRALAVGAAHSLLVLSNGALFATGSNARGQLGIGARNNPFELTTFEQSELSVAARFTDARCSLLHSVLLSDEGAVFVAGQNEYGQLGLAGPDDRFRFTRIELGSIQGCRVVAIACGSEVTYCITEDGRVHAAGNNRFGQLGVAGLPASDQMVHVPLPDGRRARQIEAGERHALALCEDGALVGWGDNAKGQVRPSGKSTPVHTPELLDVPTGGAPIRAIAVGKAHNVVLAGGTAG